MSQAHRLHQTDYFTADVGMMMRVAHVNGVSHPHDHDFMEIALISAGQGWHDAVVGEQRLGPGDVLVLRPGVWHAYRDCKHLEVYNCGFSPALLRRELTWLLEDPQMAYLLREGPLAEGQFGLLTFNLDRTALATVIRHMHRLRDLLDAPHRPTRAVLVGALLMVLGVLADAAGQSRTTSPPEQPLHPAVVNGISLLEDDPSRDWRLDDLANRVHTDPSYLVRLFKRDTGLSPIAYLARHRAELAAALLLRESWPIQVIASEVGWPDPNYFARRFKAHFGMTASAYRRRYRGHDNV